MGRRFQVTALLHWPPAPGPAQRNIVYAPPHRLGITYLIKTDMVGRRIVCMSATNKLIDLAGQQSISSLPRKLTALFE